MLILQIRGHWWPLERPISLESWGKKIGVGSKENERRESGVSKDNASRNFIVKITQKQK